MHEVNCRKRCCHAVYCPLELCWATTVHKFQGFEAGFDDDDNINHIIADIDNLAWEKTCPGTAYVVASRAKSIGQVTKEEMYPTKSNLFFIGTLGSHRFEKCIKKQDGSICKSVIKRELWTGFLKSRAKETKIRLSTEEISSKREFVQLALDASPIKVIRDLKARIIDMITSPNDDWKKHRNQYLSDRLFN